MTLFKAWVGVWETYNADEIERSVECKGVCINDTLVGILFFVFYGFIILNTTFTLLLVKRRT